MNAADELHKKLVALLASNCVGAYGLGGLANKILDLISQHEQQPPPDEAAAKADEPPVVAFVSDKQGDYACCGSGAMGFVRGLAIHADAKAAGKTYRRLEIPRDEWDENKQLRIALLNEGRSAEGWKLRHDAEREAREKATAQLALAMERLHDLLPGHDTRCQCIHCQYYRKRWENRCDGLDNAAAQELLEKARRCEEVEADLDRIHKVHWDAVKLLTDKKE